MPEPDELRAWRSVTLDEYLRDLAAVDVKVRQWEAEARRLREELQFLPDEAVDARSR